MTTFLNNSKRFFHFICFNFIFLYKRKPKHYKKLFQIDIILQMVSCLVLSITVDFSILNFKITVKIFIL